jgi:hypothetical protein
MGRGRHKEKVQQAFLQRKWLLGGYLTLWEKEEMRTIVDLVTLRHSLGDDFESCGDREAIALRSRRSRSTTGPASRHLW